jgi:hypothetical protein
MLSLAYVACAAVLAVGQFPASDTLPSVAAIAPLVAEQPSALGARLTLEVPSITIDGAARLPLTGLGIGDPAPADTVRKPRRKAYEYSDLYHTRLTIHKWLSWTMLPLFAASYVTGDELLKANAAGRTPKDWARTWHGPAASGSAVLFSANTITGAWNLWEGRGDPNGRKRRIVHSVLFMAASAGFVYAGTQLADEAQQSQDKRLQHRNVAIASMGVSTFSWLIMLIGN